MSRIVVNDIERLELAPLTPEERKLFKEATATADFARVTLKLTWEEDSRCSRLIYSEPSHLRAVAILFETLASRMEALQHHRRALGEQATTEVPDTPPGA